MFIEFATPGGRPVFLIPEDVRVVSGYRKADQQTGELQDRSMVLLANRETLWLAGHASVICAAVEDAKVAQAAVADLKGCPEVIDCLIRPSANTGASQTYGTKADQPLAGFVSDQRYG